LERCALPVGKNVTKRSKAVSCDSCDGWTHIRCTHTISTGEYKYLVLGGPLNFTCDFCLFSSLLFHEDNGLLDGSLAQDVATPETAPDNQISLKSLIGRGYILSMRMSALCCRNSLKSNFFLAGQKRLHSLLPRRGCTRRCLTPRLLKGPKPKWWWCLAVHQKRPGLQPLS
jgi:hypothetical protein